MSMLLSLGLNKINGYYKKNIRCSNVLKLLHLNNFVTLKKINQ